jgi:hypothetical protein
MIIVFLGITSYLIDAYTIFAALALAASSLLRSLFGFAFPLFTTYMYQNLGIHWASSVPAFLALACVPAPFFLYRWGASIRSRCTYAAASDAAMQSMYGQGIRGNDTYHSSKNDSAVSINEKEADTSQDGVNRQQC